MMFPSYFWLTASYQNVFGLQVPGLTCLDWEEDYLHIALLSVHHVKESSAQLHLQRRGGNILHLLNDIKN